VWSAFDELERAWEEERRFEPTITTGEAGERHVWTFAASAESLAPGERAAFLGRAPAPDSASQLELRFVRPSDLGD